MSRDVTITCELRTKPEVLRIDYEIVNHSDRAIYAFVLPVDAHMEPYHQQTYAALSSNRRMLYLVVDKPPLPASGLRPGQKEAAPLASYMKPGASFEDRFMIYFPVREWHAYALPQESEYGASSQIEHAVLSLCYVFEDEARHAERSTVPGFHAVQGEVRRKLVTTLKLPEPILVQELLDSSVRMTF